jgi:hypothetical protein
MSYFSYRATAKCKLNATTLEEAVHLCVNQALLGNNNQDIPVELEDHSFEELCEELQPYFQSFYDDGQVVVFVDTEECSGNAEFFDYITSILCKIQSGDHLEISWSSYDSREGIAGGTDYYNQDGQPILIDSISNLGDKLSNIEQITNWCASDAIKLEAIKQELLRSL